MTLILSDKLNRMIQIYDKKIAKEKDIYNYICFQE